MKWRVEKVSTQALMALTVAALAVFFLAEKTVKPERAPYYRTKLKAAQTMSLAENTLKEERLRLGLAIDPVNDPNKTGLIGQEYTLTTTDRGKLQSKLLTTNPNFAAMVVDMLKKAGLKKGDRVAVGLTGSFPGMNLAVFSALEAVELEPIVITSVGASMWGANEPNLSWLDMERILNDRGILHHHSVAASMGGGKDRGQGLSPEGRDLIREAIRRNGAILIEAPTLEESINRRVTLYDSLSQGNRIKAYINVGGGVASLGSSINGRLIPPGLSRNLAQKNFPQQGVIVLMARRGIPVIHLLEIEKLAQRYDLPRDPNVTQEIGEGKIYFTDRYSMSGVAIYTVILAFLAFVLIRVDLAYYLTPHRRPTLPSGAD